MSRRAVLAVACAIAAAVALAACERTEPDAVPNVRLGMAPRDVRDRFEPGGEGSWRTAVGGTADDSAIEWRASQAGLRLREARFEFHLGMLVAIRARSDEAPPADAQVTTTPRTVTVRRAAPAGEGGGTEIAVLARDCPTHKEEADALAAKAK